MYMYCRMYMKIQYLQSVVVQVTMDKVHVMGNVRRDMQCTCKIECT